MIILSVNAGSSSLKFTGFKMPEEEVIVSGLFERIGIAGSCYTIKLNGEKITPHRGQGVPEGDHPQRYAGRCHP